MFADLPGIAMSGPPKQDQEFYAWKFPGAPVVIQLGLRVVEKIESQQRVASVFHGEIGGVLVGRGAGIIEIEDAIPVFSNDASSPVSGAPRAAWKQAIVAAGSAQGDVGPIGCYLSTPGNIRLSAEDVSLIQEFFSGPNQVFLVIGSGVDRNAGFFFWDNRVLLSDFSFMEFPFDSQKLRPLAAAAGTVAVQEANQSEPEIEAPEEIPAAVPRPFEKLRPSLSFRNPRVQAAIGTAAVVCILLAVALTRGTKRPQMGPPAKIQSGQPAPKPMARVEMPAAPPAAAPTPPPKTEPSAAKAVNENRQPATTGTRNRGTESGAKNAVAPKLTQNAPAAVRPPVVAKAPQRQAVPSVRPVKPTGIEQNRGVVGEDSLPIPVHRVRPVVPRRLSESFSREFVVRLRVSVDANGKVLRATPLTHDAAMGPAVEMAVQAGMMWTFTPARRNGVNVPGEAIIEFRFVPTRE